MFIGIGDFVLGIKTFLILSKTILNPVEILPYQVYRPFLLTKSKVPEGGIFLLIAQDTALPT